MPNVMENIYLGITERADPVRSYLGGYALRQELEERKIREALKERELELKGEDLIKDYAKLYFEQYKFQEEALDRDLDRALRERQIIGTEKYHEWEKAYKEEELAFRIKNEARRAKLDILNYNLRAKEYEQKANELGLKTLQPVIDRYKSAVGEANAIRERLYPTGFGAVSRAPEETETLKGELEAKLREVDNLGSLIDRSVIGKSLTEPDTRTIDQRRRDNKIMETTMYITRAKTAVSSLVVDPRDINPQVAAIKQQAAEEVRELISKTKSKIADLEKKYYKELERDPDVEPPTEKIETLLLSLKNKIQEKQRKNRYIKVDFTPIDSIVYGVQKYGK